MSRFAAKGVKGIGVALVVSVVGLALIQAPYGIDLEEQYGLPWLFALRGARPSPPAVLIIAIDQYTGKRVGLPEDPADWPRSVHADLTRKLTHACAKAIVFDLYFTEDRVTGNAEENRLFADAIRESGRVVLVSHLSQRDAKLSQSSQALIEEVRLPATELINASLAVAPMLLPNLPDMVSGFWTFKSSAGDVPTLPTIAFQIHALRATVRLGKVLADTLAHAPGEFPMYERLSGRDKITELSEKLRTYFTENNKRTETIRNAVSTFNSINQADRLNPAVQSVLNLYTGEDWKYLNFYGPPRTVQTLNYADVLHLPDDVNCEKDRNIAGKIVFVGASELSPVEQKDKDVFDTAFTQSTGLKLSGTEIAATATANLIDGSSIARLSAVWCFVLVVFWGIVISIVWRSCTTFVSAMITLAALSTYAIAAFYEFNRNAYWFPLVVPLTQSFTGILLAGILNRTEADTHVREIRQQLNAWLPSSTIETLLSAPRSISRRSGLLYGTCLHTSLEGFTRLSDSIEPLALATFMENYYRAIGQPVTHGGGVISDQTGDAMLAIWATAEPDVTMRRAACLGALQIDSASVKMLVANGQKHLRTRIGVHMGSIAVGTSPLSTTGQHRTFGLIVNAAQRVQAINEVLHTRIIVSEEVVEGLGADFLVRPLGRYAVTGIVTSLTLFELLAEKKHCNMFLGADILSEGTTISPTCDDISWLCTAFSEALDAYQERDWQIATMRFLEILDRFPTDGPSLFYMRRIEYYRRRPTAHRWDPVIRV